MEFCVFKGLYLIDNDENDTINGRKIRNKTFMRRERIKSISNQSTKNPSINYPASLLQFEQIRFSTPLFQHHSLLLTCRVSICDDNVLNQYD